MRKKTRPLATERLIVPIAPSDKKAVEKKAAASRMSAAEFVRRAIVSYDPSMEERSAEAELRALLDVFKLARAQTLEQLDRTDAALGKAFAYFAAKKPA
jgi:hypothetical protein